MRSGEKRGTLSRLIGALSSKFFQKSRRRLEARMRRLLLFNVALALALLLPFHLVVSAQDGSSELTPEKTVTALGVGGRLRVRCTDDNLRLYPNATACADEREPESCRMVFNTPASSSPAARDLKCDNPLLKDLADQCRRTCAICCEDPSYACQNDESGIVNCNQNMEKCGMAEFSQMMIKFCPATCGLCLARKCWDQIEECESMKSLCTNEIYATFMEHQCARTCGKCKLPSEDGDEDSDERTESGEETQEKIHRPGTRRPDSGNENSNGHRHGGHGKKGETSRESEEEEEVSGGENSVDNEVKVKERSGGKKSGAKDRPPKRPPKDEKNDKDEEEETCVDVLKNCRKNKKFCRHKSYIEMMRQNCARTCGFCKPKSEKRKDKEKSLTKHEKIVGATNTRTAPSRAIDPDCKDNHPFCKGWAANGYCESEEYTDEEKQDKCAKTCGYC